MRYGVDRKCRAYALYLTDFSIYNIADLILMPIVDDIVVC